MDRCAWGEVLLGVLGLMQAYCQSMQACCLWIEGFCRELDTLCWTSCHMPEAAAVDLSILTCDWIAAGFRACTF